MFTESSACPVILPDQIIMVKHAAYRTVEGVESRFDGGYEH